MGGNAVHDGISIINLTTGRMGENSSIAFGKVAVGNAFFRECILGGLIPRARYERGRQALRDIKQAGS